MAERTPEQRARHAANQRRYRAEGRVNDAEWRRAWRAANADKVREINRKAGRKYAAANPDKERARREKFRAENPDYWMARRDKGREYERRYRSAHPDVRSWRRRKIAKAGVVFVIAIESEVCGVCGDPLNLEARHPDPLATSVGHEPPLAVAQREGWTVVAERPEHLRCNLRKGDRPDYLLALHTASPDQSKSTDAAA